MYSSILFQALPESNRGLLFNVPNLLSDTAVMGEAQEFVPMCDTGDCMEWLEDAWDELGGCPPEEAVGALAQDTIDALKKMCFLFCGCKAHCKIQLYGACRASDVRGAYNQAKRRG